MTQDPSENQQPQEMKNVFDSPPGDVEPEAATISPGLDRYRMWDHTSAVVCNDCGVLVSDTDAHDLFHSTNVTMKVQAEGI